MRTKTIYKQTDPKWGKLPFPGKGYTVGGSGCSCLAITHVLMETEKYRKYDPRDVRPVMTKYATYGSGLMHSGISATLNHFGIDHVFISESDPMSKAWKALEKPGYTAGVLLFYSRKGPDGTEWTGSGHFIGFTDYKVKDGKHWFYLKDSGWRNHDGWYCYEKSMKGDLPKLWICNVAAEKKKTETKKNLVVDVSYVQGKIDWEKAKEYGVQGAIVRCGYRGYIDGKLKTDSWFLKNIKAAKKAGLKVGTYFFTEAINTKEAKEEAAYTLNLVRSAGIPLSYPIAIDTEAIKDNNAVPRANNLSKKKRTAIIKAFCEEIIKQGYTPMIYASTYWLNDNLDMSKLPYKVWVAQYNNKVTYKGDYIMWQYSSLGKVPGIAGVVDLNKVAK